MIRSALGVVFLLLTGSVNAVPTGNVSKLYQSNCAVCHGDAGNGASHARQGLNPAPRDFTADDFAATASRESLAAIIRHGKPGTAMIAWGSVLSDAQIDELADYIMTAFVARQVRPATSPDEGFAVYQENCSVCHGDDGAGAVWGQESLASAPRNFTTAAAKVELSRDRMVAAVSFGKPGTPMPGFATQLDKRQIAAVVDYVRTTFMRDTGTRSVSFDSQHERNMPDNLVGDAARGQAFYLTNCVACHGINGDGNGPRAYFIFPRPRNFLDPATRQIFDRSRLFVGIRDGVKGKEMPAWGKVLGDQDIVDIAEYVYRDFILPEASSE